MFFERINRFRRSLVFRLTLLYTAIFTISIFVAFFIFYQVIISKIHARTDNDLNVKMNEFSALYNGPQNSDSVISYTWEIKGGGPSGTNAKEVSAFI
jgi:hypothetical protein